MNEFDDTSTEFCDSPEIDTSCIGEWTDFDVESKLDTDAEIGADVELQADEESFQSEAGKAAEYARSFGFEKAAETIMKYKEVETVYLMSGSYDLCVIVKGKTFQEVAMFVAKELATMHGVTSTATHFVLRRYKELDVELVGEEQDDRGAYSL
jgi:DNA-binding Lrp family transcriptional regulator